MTVAADDSFVVYEGDGERTSFLVPFTWADDDELHVTLRPDTALVGAVLTRGVDYTVAGVGEPSGTLTTTTPPAFAAQLTIERRLPIVQLTKFTEQGSFSAALHEAALDYRTRVDQQIARRLDVLEAILAEVRSRLTALEG